MEQAKQVTGLVSEHSGQLLVVGPFQSKWHIALAILDMQFVLGPPTFDVELSMERCKLVKAAVKQKRLIVKRFAYPAAVYGIPAQQNPNRPQLQRPLTVSQ